MVKEIKTSFLGRGLYSTVNYLKGVDVMMCVVYKIKTLITTFFVGPRTIYYSFLIIMSEMMIERKEKYIYVVTK